VTSGATPLRARADFYTGGTIPWFKTKELADGFLLDSEEHITPLAVATTSAKVYPANSVLMAMYGDGRTITTLGILRQPSSCNQACCVLIANPEVCDYRFLFYALKYHRDDFIRLATGGAQRNLSGRTIKEFELPVPPIVDQRAIAGVLGALDDKIELNRRMNETLEAVARALFKSWFVDFDPVRAKAEGRQPWGMDAETAALFPGEFEESELGEIPKGWRVGRLDELARVLMGQSPPGDTYNEAGEGLPFYQGTRDFGWRFPKMRVYCTAPTRTATEDDVLLSVRAPVGTLNLAREKCAIGRGVATISPNASEHSYVWYALDATKSGWERFEAQGTVFGSASREDVNGFRLLEPPPALRRRFSALVSTLDARIRLNTIESETLVKLRDTLLPKLLSGNVRVRVVDPAVETTL